MRVDGNCANSSRFVADKGRQTKRLGYTHRYIHINIHTYRKQDEGDELVESLQAGVCAVVFVEVGSG